VTPDRRTDHMTHDPSGPLRGQCHVPVGWQLGGGCNPYDGLEKASPNAMSFVLFRSDLTTGSPSGAARVRLACSHRTGETGRRVHPTG
jgi:hypothetical protein